MSVRVTLLCALLSTTAGAQTRSYDIVYVRALRAGDRTLVELPEIMDPIQIPSGADLMLLHPDGTEEVLVAGGNGAIVDPCVSFDGQWVYYAKLHDQRPGALNFQRRNASVAGSDLFKIHLTTRQVVQLTHQEWTPNTGIAQWSSDPLRAVQPNDYYVGYGMFNLGPCELPGGKVMFCSSRNNFLPNKSFTFPNLQLFVMDNDGKNVELIGHLNLGSALHPVVLADGRVMFASYESQGLRDQRLWSLWAIWPDGRAWQPLMSAFTDSYTALGLHFHGQNSRGDILVTAYYNLNNNGFGTILGFPTAPPTGLPGFGKADPNDPSNPTIRRGVWPGGMPRYTSFAFSPYGLYALTAFTHGEDSAASPQRNGAGYAGKATQPSGAPNNDVLVVWSPGPCNDLNRPTPYPRYNAGLYIVAGGAPIDDHTKLVLIKNDPSYNELQPRAVVPYQKIYGVKEPATLPWFANDGTASGHLPAGTPFGLLGTASFYKRDTKPGVGVARFNGLDAFNTSQNNSSTNYTQQGADAGQYLDDDIHAVRILAMEPTSHTSYGPRPGRGFFNHANERLRILGEIPLRKYDAQGQPILDIDGNPDTSFLAKIPADVPFTFQTIDQDGLVLNMAQTWHQVRPGEMRVDCGGCHAHSQTPTNFYATAAAQPGYRVLDLAQSTPLLSKDAAGNPILTTKQLRAVDVEYYRDVKPILQRSCVPCHTATNPAPPAQLVLDDAALRNVEPYNSFLAEGTYLRLAADTSALYGIPPVIVTRTWRGTNVSRYVRPFQARRSLLVWKVFGRRLDGWNNSDHPTESTPGDPTTLPPGTNPDDADLDYTGTIMPPPGSGVPPLTYDEQMTIARWVDLGAPIDSTDSEERKHGWLADDLRPTLTITTPRAGTGPVLGEVRIGAFDYGSGLNRSSLSVVADFAVNGRAAGAELADLFTEQDHVWTMPVRPPLQDGSGQITVRISDVQGNETKLDRSFATTDRLPAAVPTAAARSN